MTPSDRLESDLPRVLEHLYLGARPAYADEALRRAVAEPRRRAGFLGRLLWPAHTYANSRPEQRHPWRTVVLVGAIALLLAATAIVAGGRPRPSLPPAGNGLIAYDHDGDIYVGDPVTGVTSAIVTSPEQDRGPVFSPDGALIAFVRRHPVTVESTGSAQMPAGWQPVGASDIVVVRADGSDARVITPQRQVALESVGWSPDGRSIVANVLDVSGPEDVYREMAFDVAGRGEPRVVGSPANLPDERDGIRSPSGDRVLILGDPTRGRPLTVFCDAPAWSHSIEIRDAEGGNPTVLVDRARLTSLELPTHQLRQIEHSPSVAWSGWSPDGSRIYFHVRVDYEIPCDQPAPTQLGATGLPSRDAPIESWVYVMNADGSDLRRVTQDLGPVEPDAFITEGFPSWSPDGSRIALDRSVTTESGDTQCCMVIVADIASGRQLAIDASATGYDDPDWDSLSWAPDGRSLLFYDSVRSRLVMVDAETGAPTELPWQVGYDPDWQRVPPN